MLESDKITLHKELRTVMEYLRANSGPGVGAWSRMSPHIFLTNFANACNETYIRDAEIDVILYLGIKPKSSDVQELYKTTRVDHFQIPVINGTNIQLFKYFDLCYNKIFDAVYDEKNIIVHCVTGEYIGAAIMIYYYLKRYYYTQFRKDEDDFPNDIDLMLASTDKYMLLSIIKSLKNKRPSINLPAPIIYQLLVAEFGFKQDAREILDEHDAAETAKKREEMARAADQRIKKRAARRKKQTDADVSEPIDANVAADATIAIDNSDVVNAIFDTSQIPDADDDDDVVLDSDEEIERRERADEAAEQCKIIERIKSASLKSPPVKKEVDENAVGKTEDKTDNAIEIAEDGDDVADEGDDEVEGEEYVYVYVDENGDEIVDD